MNTILKEITNWCEESGLKISTPKTHALLWARTRDRNIFPTHIIINHAKVTLSDTTKYLGIIINNKLNFNDHIDHQVTTCKNSLFAAKRIIDKKWGLNPKNTAWLYEAVTLPKLLYGCLIWGPKLTQTQIKKLETVQTLANHLITRCLVSTPKMLLNTILHQPSIQISIRDKILKTALKMKKTNTWPDKMNPEPNNKYLTSQEIIEQALKDQYGKNLDNQNTDTMIPMPNLDINFKTKISTRDNFKIKEEGIKILTDGSKDEFGKTAYGIYFENGEIDHIKERMEDHNTVFQAEAQAITEAANKLIDKQIKGQKITIYSDSQASIKGLTATKNKKHYIRTLESTIKALNKLATNNKVTVCWVPGHSGYEGNEIADDLANKGRKMELIKNFSVPFKHLIREIKQSTEANIYKRFKTQPIDDESKIITNQLLEAADNKTIKLRNHILRLNPEEIGIFIRIISGHNNLNYHLERIGYS